MLRPPRARPFWAAFLASLFTPLAFPACLLPAPRPILPRPPQATPEPGPFRRG